MSKHDLSGITIPSHAIRMGITSGRDRRVDFLRGLAVLAISANHIWPQSGLKPHYPYPAYKFGHFFAFDFADVFLLLSGIVAGIVFFPVLVQGGLQKCYTRSLRRAGQIWGVHILCVFAALSIILVFERALGATGLLLTPFETSISSGFARNLLLYQPSIFLDILPIYVGLLLVLPLALMVFKYSPAAFIAVTVSIWAMMWVSIQLAQAGMMTLPELALKTPFFIHPFAAQLLFFTGVAIGIHKRDIEAFIAARRGKILIGSVVCIVISDFLSQVVWPAHHFSDKYYMDPSRLTDLLAVMAIIWCLVKPENLSQKQHTLVESCGRHILPVFAVTTVSAIFLTYLNYWLDAGPLVYGLCILGNVLLCLATAHVLEKRRTSGVAERPRPAAMTWSKEATSIGDKTDEVLGVTFKPDLDDMRAPEGLSILSALAGKGATGRAVDQKGRRASHDTTTLARRRQARMPSSS